MPRHTAGPLAHLGALGLRLERVELGPGLTLLRIHSRATQRMGFPVCAYLVDDLLVDTGFAHARGLVRDALEGRNLGGITLTHHHEDHAGNAGGLAARHGCPVYLRRPERLLSEGVGTLAPYRRMYWGWPEPYDPVAMPAELDTGRRSLRCVPTGGHSTTHTAFFEPEQGLLFTGDLYVSRGASAVLTHEDPFTLLASLQAVEALGAERLLTGHGLDQDDPGPVLRHKIQRLEDAMGRILALHDQGMNPGAIRRRVFPKGQLADLGGALLTGGEFSRANLVRAVITHRPQPT
jgi:endoribonuclease LACTB2